jgi:predicted HTH transcriptional regulator
MTRDNLLALREDADFEAKLARGQDGQGKLPESLWPTYSAMANTHGGRILLGARELKDGSLRLEGIPDLPRVRKALWDGLNNPKVVSQNLLGNDDVEVLDVDGVEHPLLLVTVPAAARRQRPLYIGENPLTGTFKRNFEGDYHCSKSEVRRMLAEAERDARDAEVLRGFRLADLDQSSLDAYRNLFRSTKPGHVWLALDDQELLRRLGGWAVDRERGEEGLTLAGLLMFGQLHTIREAVPDYLLDYQERLSPDPKVRWTDRLTLDGTWSGNLFDFYRLVYPRHVADLKVPFRLEEGSHRVDETPVHEALREAFVNALIHADFGLSTGIQVLKYSDHFEFRNPGGLRIPRSLAIGGGHSDCRNRSLQKMFQMIGAGEQAGSGVPRILAAWREQHWRAPLLEEHAEPEHTTLQLSMISLLPPEVLAVMEQRFGDGYRAMPEVERLALATAFAENRVTNERLREISGLHPSDLTTLLRGLVDRGFLERHGSGRASYYELATGYRTTPTLFDRSEAADSGIRPETMPLNDRQRRAIRWIREHGSISPEEYRNLLGVPRHTAARDLSDLVRKQVLHRTGRTSAIRYWLHESAS